VVPKDVAIVGVANIFLQLPQQGSAYVDVDPSKIGGLSAAASTAPINPFPRAQQTLPGLTSEQTGD
jgi:hypothetical protein